MNVPFFTLCLIRLDAPKQVEKILTAALESGKSKFGSRANRRCWVNDAGVHQVDEFMGKDRIIDFKDLVVFYRGKRSVKEFSPNAILQRFFNFQISGEFCLNRSGHIRQISLTGIVEQAGKLHQLRVPTGLGFPCTVDAVLAHGVESFKMSVGAAQHGKGVCNVHNIDQRRIRMQGIEHFMGSGHNLTHLDTHFLCLCGFIVQLLRRSVNSCMCIGMFMAEKCCEVQCLLAIMPFYEHSGCTGSYSNCSCGDHNNDNGIMITGSFYA